jgi:predicted RNase H-like HicB family nuclease
MRYAIVIEKAKNNYAAYSPDIPGCVAVGETLKEVKQQMQETIEFHFAGLKEEGLPIPEPTTLIEYVDI